MAYYVTKFYYMELFYEVLNVNIISQWRITVNFVPEFIWCEM